MKWRFRMLMGFGMLFLLFGLVTFGVFLQMLQTESFDLLNPGRLLWPASSAFFLIMLGGCLVTFAQNFATIRQVEREKRWMNWLMRQLKPGIEKGEIATYETLCSVIVAALESNIVSMSVVRWGLIEERHASPAIQLACERTFKAIVRRTGIRTTGVSLERLSKDRLSLA